jgi:hypothetical protein
MVTFTPLFDILISGEGNAHWSDLLVFRCLSACLCPPIGASPGVLQRHCPRQFGNEPLQLKNLELQVHGNDYADYQPAIENEVSASPNAHEMRQSISMLGKEHEIYAGKCDNRYGLAQEARFLPVYKCV